MNAAAIDRFGGPEVFRVRPVSVPVPGAGEVLIHLESAGVGVWDPLIRTGELSFGPGSFPLIMGNDGAGTVAAVGDNVKAFKEGDRVYAAALEGGFYAEFVVVKEDGVARLPPAMNLTEAGALGGDGMTALRGLEDQLRLRAGERVLIFGASGGVGHLAVQLAKRLGAEVLAVASRADGVELVRRLGADVAIDGRDQEMMTVAREFAHGGIDAALVLANPSGAGELLQQVKRGGAIAYPNGVQPAPPAPDGVRVVAYDGVLDRAGFDRMNALIGSAPFHVHVWRTYSLEEAARAHRELAEHHIGKSVFRM